MTTVFKFLLGFVLFIFSILIFAYTVYYIKCFKKVGVARVVFNQKIEARAYLYNTCSSKILDTFNLNTPKIGGAKTKSAKLAKLFELKDLNSNLDDLSIVTSKDLELKKEAKQKLNLKIKFSSIKNLYKASIKTLNLQKQQNVILLISSNDYSLYIQKNKQNINLDYLRDNFSEIPIDRIEQRKLILSLIRTLKENPFNFKNHRVSVVTDDSLLLGQKILSKKKIVELLDRTDNLDTIKNLLVLFSIMESFDIKQVYFDEFPYLGFAGL